MYNNSYHSGFNRSYGNRRKQQYINPARFIQKAQEMPEQTEQYVPKHNFSDFQITEQLKKNILAHGYTTPTPIQDQTIPSVLEGKDVIGIANTGTGKTAAFLIPLINKVLTNRSEKVLIVVPTRELAVQIEEEFLHFAKFLMLSSVLCIGGAFMQKQMQGIRQNPSFIIGTPGRLKDLVQRRNLKLFYFKNIVLDEVDKMLDMGFIHDMKFLINELPPVRQSLFFSATISPQIRDLMQVFLKDPITVSVKTHETAAHIEQDIVKLKGRNTIDVLHDLLIQDEYKKVLLFGRTKYGVEKLARTLAQRRFRVASIHGNKSQNQRQRALTQFKTNQIQVLLATDVASRGLDIDDVTHVINFDLPQNYDDYVHRIGRTGRANKKGMALTFVD